MTPAEYITERLRIHGAATEGPWKTDYNSGIMTENGIELLSGYYVAGYFDEQEDADATVDAHNHSVKAWKALGKVLELHEPISGFVGDPSHRECNVCGDERGPKPFPCPTVKAITEILGVSDE